MRVLTVPSTFTRVKVATRISRRHAWVLRADHSAAYVRLSHGQETLYFADEALQAHWRLGQESAEVAFIVETPRTWLVGSTTGHRGPIDNGGLYFGGPSVQPIVAVLHGRDIFPTSLEIVE